MQLSVRPDDLSTAAGALRRLHDSLAGVTSEFGDLAARLTTGIGPQAAETVMNSAIAARYPEAPA